MGFRNVRYPNSNQSLTEVLAKLVGKEPDDEVMVDPHDFEMLQQEEDRNFDPEFMASESRARLDRENELRMPAELAAYAKAGAQLGTINGKVADTSAVGDWANAASGSKMQMYKEAQDEQSRKDKMTGLRLRTLQYLQEKQDKLKAIKDKQAFDAGEAQKDRSFKASEYSKDRTSREKMTQMKEKSEGKKLSGFDKLAPEEQEEIKTLAKRNAEKVGIISQMENELSGFREALKRGDRDGAVVIGNGMLKLANSISMQGPDAVGAEEANRIGTLLKFKLFNLLEPGPAFGRDFEGFYSQMTEKLNAAKRAVEGNRQRIESIYKGGYRETPKEINRDILKDPPKSPSLDNSEYNKKAQKYETGKIYQKNGKNYRFNGDTFELVK